MEPEILHGEFDTLLLDNSSGQEGEHEKCRGSIFDSEDHLLSCFIFIFSCSLFLYSIFSCNSYSIS